MIVRCSDMNPRRLIHMFSALVDAWPQERWLRTRRAGEAIIPGTVQTDTLVRIASEELAVTYGAPVVGPGLVSLINDIGDALRGALHADRIPREAPYAFSLDANAGDRVWEAVRHAVHRGVMYPVRTYNRPDRFPQEAGVFRLSYCFAPYYRLLPRAGRERSLRSLVTARQLSDAATQLSLAFIESPRAVRPEFTA